MMKTDKSRKHRSSSHSSNNDSSDGAEKRSRKHGGKRDEKDTEDRSRGDGGDRQDRSRHNVEKHREKERNDGERYRDRSNVDRGRRDEDRDQRRRYNDRNYNRRDREVNDRRDRDGNDRRNRDDRRSPRNYRDNDNRSNNPRFRRERNRSGSFDHTNARWGKGDQDDKRSKDKQVEKEKPNFGLSGKLTEETNTYRGVVIKYSEPPEARKPKRRWRLYPFKGEKALQTLYIHRESAYLIGRERKVVDLPVDHPSCSKQHAALQYRLVPFTREDGSSGKRVRPYLIDLESANGTYINNKKIDPKKYIELLEKDVIKFGFSSREYVLLHENSKDEAQDDDVKPEEETVKEEPEN